MDSQLHSKRQLPFVSVMLPVRNEGDYIVPVIEAIMAQDYPSELFELIIAEGMSTDDTVEQIHKLMRKYPNIRLLENPKRIVPTGLNLAIHQANGEVVVRIDGHCKYPREYISKLINLLEESGAANVGGALVAVGDSNYSQSAIRLAYRSPFSVGTALRSYDSHSFTKEVDDVHGGCWRKETLLNVGCFDESMVRNQDDELSFRIRKNGGKILQDASIRVSYFVRDSFGKLFKQFLQYGYWKVPVIQKHLKQASLRHFLPALLVAGLVFLSVLCPFLMKACVIFALMIAVYIASILFMALTVAVKVKSMQFFPGIVFALISMHIAYGIGFILGIVRTFVGATTTDKYFQKLSR